MSDNWFFSIYFEPQNNLLPELITEDGARSTIRDIAKIGLLQSVLQNTFLKYETRPFIIFNGTHNLENLEKVFISEKHKRILQEQEVAFYFFEPLTHYKSPLHIKSIPGHILRIDNDPYEIARIRSFELDSISMWAAKHDIPSLKVYCTDYNCWTHYQQFYPNIKLLSMDLFINWETSQDFSVPDDYVLRPELITKKFWCGAWRYDPSRHFILAYLAHRNLTLSNNVSFFFDISDAEFKRRMWFAWKEFQTRHANMSEQLIDGNQKLRKQVPLSIEIDETVALSEYAMDPEYDGAGKNLRASQNPTNSYHDSFCAIVLESRVTQPWPNISEKTINAIKNNRPFIMVGAPGTLKMLKKMGFKTFDKWWDESYDDIVCNQDRMVKICEIIDHVNSFNLSELTEMYNDMADVLLHNNKNQYRIPKFYIKTNKRLLKNSK